MTATVVESGQAAVEALTAAARPSGVRAGPARREMPDMDGFGGGGNRETPELAGATSDVTSSGEYGDHARCAELGIVAYLTKPVYAADLLTAIERAIGSKPSAVAPPAATSRAGALAMSAEGQRARILLVEDNLVNQQVASGLLTRRGHHVTVAQDGREALVRLDHETFDLVLMDVQMPSGDARRRPIRLRERRTGPRPHVAMTAHSMTAIASVSAAVWTSISRADLSSHAFARQQNRAPRPTAAAGPSRSTRTHCGTGSPATTTDDRRFASFL